MAVKRPYFNLHQIITGKYSEGNEFILESGEIYVGSYHVLPTGQRFTGFRPEPKSAELFEIRLNPTQDILKYNQISENGINKSVSPISMSPQITLEQYKKGRIQRFFVQKRNSPENTIVEIDSQQFNQINTQNNPGINGIIWNKLMIWWRISKIPMEDVYYLNQLETQKNEPNFPGLGKYLSNPLEFYH